MLLIQKTFPPQNLINFNAPRRTTSTNPTYQELGADTTLFQEVKAYLENEQRGLCCYCMQRVTASNCNVEHFLPQSIFPEYQTDYYNLYLACRYSHGKPKSEQYCDIRKSDSLIAKILNYRLATGETCQNLFQYSEIDGLILPKHSNHKTIKAFTADFTKLSDIQKEVLSAIEILNLNAIELKEARRKFITNIKPTIDNAARRNVEAMKTDYETAQNKKFAGVALYFINERLNRLNQNN